MVEKRFESRDVRYVRIAPTSQRPWEIAELEVYGDGSLPTGEFRSKPMRLGLKVFGLVRYEGRGIDSSPVLVHTRVGPDKEPEWYFLLEEDGDEVVRAKNRAEYLAAPPHLHGPVRPNPNWSGWEPVSQGVVRSPNLNTYMQFRVRLFTPGVRLDRLVFETIFPPLVQSVVAEVSPDTVAAGVETEFALAMLAHMKIPKSGNRVGRSDTGFERILIETDAHIGRVRQVRIDDRSVPFTSRRRPDGVYVDLRRQVEQDGSFLQVVFRGTVYRDKTAFRIRVLDDRVVDKRTSEGTVEIEETGYHFAVPGDADAETPARGLIVTLEKQGERAPLLANFELGYPVLTPNGDGINDRLNIGYSLLTVTRPVAGGAGAVRSRRAPGGRGRGGAAGRQPPAVMGRPRRRRRPRPPGDLHLPAAGARRRRSRGAAGDRGGGVLMTGPTTGGATSRAHRPGPRQPGTGLHPDGSRPFRASRAVMDLFPLRRHLILLPVVLLGMAEAQAQGGYAIAGKRLTVQGDAHWRDWKGAVGGHLIEEGK